jgi:hypothetical protein
MTAQEWIEAFAVALDAEPPDESEIAAILDLAAVAAHSSERIAAPVACWMAGRSGAALEELKDRAESVAGG